MSITGTFANTDLNLSNPLGRGWVVLEDYDPSLDPIVRASSDLLPSAVFADRPESHSPDLDLDPAEASSDSEDDRQPPRSVKEYRHVTAITNPHLTVLYNPDLIALFPDLIARCKGTPDSSADQTTRPRRVKEPKITYPSLEKAPFTPEDFFYSSAKTSASPRAASSAVSAPVRKVRVFNFSARQ